jgi:hypothetical protein
VDAAWTKDSSSTVAVDTQAGWARTGIISPGGLLEFDGVGSFVQLLARDIFNYSTEPFGDYT